MYLSKPLRNMEIVNGCSTNVKPYRLMVVALAFQFPHERLCSFGDQHLNTFIKFSFTIAQLSVITPILRCSAVYIFWQRGKKP